MDTPLDEGLAQLLAEARAIDRRLADERRECSQYAPSDPRQNIWKALRSQSEPAWKAVFDRVNLIKSMTDDLRRPLDEEILFEPPAPVND